MLPNVPVVSGWRNNFSVSVSVGAVVICGMVADVLSQYFDHCASDAHDNSAH
jgi:hypothetical protein